MLIDIRKEIPQDIEDIGTVTRLAFAGTDHATGTETAIVDALRAAGALTLSLVAIERQRVVGHVAFSPVTIHPRSDAWFGLGPISVHPDHQRAGIGAALIREGLRLLHQSLGAAGCVVLGDPAYYGRFGFRADPALNYPGPPAVYFQCLAFNDCAPAGEVTYHPAFETSRG